MSRVLLLAAVLAVLVPVPCDDARGELLGPGRYRGWVMKDRWGGLHLANGVYLLALDDGAAKKAKPFVGKPVAVDVDERGVAGMEPLEIRDVAGITTIPAGHPKLEVHLSVGVDRLKPAAEQRLALTVKYEGRKPLEFQLRDLVILVRRRGAPLKMSARNVMTQDRRGALWTTGGLSMRVIEPERLHENRAVFRAPGGRLAVKGPFVYTTELIGRFPPGKYDVWAALGGVNFSGAPDGRSTMLPFEVQPKKR